MKIIGLTGGIGTGKSTVSDYLKQKQYAVIDADQVAHEVVEKGSEGLAALTAQFGSQILDEDGALDRRRLAEAVFSDEEKRRELNRILHGRIGARIDAQLDDCRRAGADVVFLDVPLLIETGMHKIADEIWVVDAEDSVRIRRVMQRDGLSRQDVLSRIRSQMPREEKWMFADVILDNNGTPVELYQKIDGLLEERL